MTERKTDPKWTEYRERVDKTIPQQQEKIKENEKKK